MAGLFGFGGGSNPYAGNVVRQTDMLQGYGQQFGGLASQAGGNYARYNPQYQQALGTYAGLLGRNATDSDKAGYVNQMTQGVQGQFLAGQAGLAQNLAQRGLSPNSSVNAGAQAILEGQRAAALGQAGNQASQYFDQRRLSNANELQGLFGNAANQALGQQGQFLGAGQGASQAALSGLLPMYEQAEQQRYANQQAIYGLLGQAAGIGGQLGAASLSRRPQGY